MKTLYQIENEKSGRRLIYEGFDLFYWSKGNGEDGTFFKFEELKFAMKFVPRHQLSEIAIVEYKIRKYDADYLRTITDIKTTSKGLIQEEDLI